MLEPTNTTTTITIICSISNKEIPIMEFSAMISLLIQDQEIKSSTFIGVSPPVPLYFVLISHTACKFCTIVSLVIRDQEIKGLTIISVSPRVALYFLLISRATSRSWYLLCNRR